MPLGMWRDAHRGLDLVDVLPARPAAADSCRSRTSVGVDLDVDVSASGSTATVAVDVWMRPCVSVAGTRCTRWHAALELEARVRALARDVAR